MKKKIKKIIIKRDEEAISNLIEKLEKNKPFVQRLADDYLSYPSFQSFNNALSFCLSHDLAELIPYYQLNGKEVIINLLEVEDHNSIQAKTPEEIRLLNLWNNFLNAAMEFYKVLYFEYGIELFHIEDKKLYGFINVSNWGKLDQDGNIILNAKYFESITKSKKKENSNRIQEAKD